MRDRVMDVLASAVLRLLAACILLTQALSAFASPTGLVISQVYGGGGNSGATLRQDFIELFNAGTLPVSLNGLSVQYGSATGTIGVSGTTVLTTALPNVALQPGQYFLIRQAAGTGGTTDLPAPDLVATPAIAMSANNGKVALVTGTSALACGSATTPCTAAELARIVDLVGYGSANLFEGPGPVPALLNATAARRVSGCTDTDDNLADFLTAAPVPRNGATAFAPCAPGDAPIVTTCPAISVAAGTAGESLLSASDADNIVVTASPVVPVGAVPPFSVIDVVPADAVGGTLTARLVTEPALGAGSYGFDVSFANDAGRSASCRVAVTVDTGSIVRIHTIQGPGAASPLVGQTVTTEGIVTLVTNAGFFVQDPVPDADPLTSEGLFVFTGAAPVAPVAVGNLLRLTGRVTEFNTVTELVDPSGYVLLGSGLAIAPQEIVLPEAVEGELERHEGMLVRIASTLTVSQNFFQGRYGQVTLSAGGRMFQPTQSFRPNTPEALQAADANARRRIVLDDGSSAQNPNPIPYVGQDNTLRAGDTVTGLTGVIDHGLITNDPNGPRDYKLQPTTAPVFTRVNARTIAPAAVGGNLKVASFNVLNYFTTLDQAGAQCLPSGTRTDCRGADSATEFTRQRDKIVAALRAIDADVVGLIEIQRNGQVAVQNLVDALNAAIGTVTYAAVTLPANNGTDAIQQAMIYRSARVSPVGAERADADPVHDRPPLAQAFAAANGERFAVVVNHLKSKRCDDATGADLDQGDGQACYNARRIAQAQALVAFVADLQVQAATDRVLVIGDLNAYGQEDPIQVLRDAGLVDLVGRYDPRPYGFVFDGSAGQLDHAFGTPAAAAAATGATEWHINADEPSVIDYNTEFKPQDLYTATPYRSSDHDPVIVGLSLVRTIDGTEARDSLAGTPGDDRLEGGPGADTITTGGGRDRVVYRSLRDALDAVTDFTPGQDVIDLTALLAAIGRAGVDAFADGTVRLLPVAGGTMVAIDADGSAGPLAPRGLVLLRNLSPAQVLAGRDVVVQ